MAEIDREDLLKYLGEVPEPTPEAAETPVDDRPLELGEPIPGLFDDVSLYETDEDLLKGRKNYKFFLSHFEDPLDVLLYQVKIHKIAIEDIFISDITEQYLEIISHLDGFDDAEIEYAGEFIVMASELLYYKSVRVLPVEGDAELAADSPVKIFFDRIKEREMFIKMSNLLKKQEVIQRFYREPVYTDEDYRLTIKSFSIEKLMAAYASLIVKVAREEVEIPVKVVKKERFSVSNRYNYISARIRTEKSLKFTDLFDEDFSKIEITTTFLALLELLKRQQIHATQTELYGEITLEAVEGADFSIITEEDIDDGESD